MHIVMGDSRPGLNPKVRNLIAGYEQSRHGLLVVSDSNVRVRPGYLRKAVPLLHDPHVGLVHHLVRGTQGGSLGAVLDNGYLNTFVVGSVALFDRFGIRCVVGKSILMRRRDLEALGGFEAVKDYLAEDAALATRIRHAGLRVVLAPTPVERVAIRGGVGCFVRRYVRWGTLRRSISGPAYAAEALAGPAPIALVLGAIAAITRGVSDPAILAAPGALAAKIVLDVGTQTAFGVRLRLRDVAVGPLRDLLLFYAWAAGYWTRTVVWRDNRLVVRRGSRLEAPRIPAGRALRGLRSLRGLRRAARARRPAAG